VTIVASGAPTVFVDADNTLWDTDGVFARAQLGLLEDLEHELQAVAPGERLEFIRYIDQTLAENHHLGLRYPARYLVLAAARGLQGSPLDRSLTSVWQVTRQDDDPEDRIVSGVEARYLEKLRQQPPLLDGVEAGLRSLQSQGCRVFVVTEGSRARAMRSAQALGIGHYIQRFIESPKHPRLYQRVLRLAGSPSVAFMIGDQLQRDIKPALEAGLVTIYVPSRFQPRWERSETVRPDYRCESFERAVDAVRDHVARLQPEARSGVRRSIEGC